jgi:hypothetical protein
VAHQEILRKLENYNHGDANRHLSFLSRCACRRWWACAAAVQARRRCQTADEGAVDPNADVIWEATGSIVSKEGTENRRPENQQEWDAVRNSAIVLAEAGNLLMMAPRAKDGDVWMKRIYEACSHCHQEYMDAIKNANK